jgi:DNA (cytosine-5)-methyltransferase 1
MKPKFSSIFCGVGCPFLGAEWAGFESLFGVETRKYFNIKTFRYNFPKTLYSTDIDAFQNLYSDVIWLSPSCGEFSSASRGTQHAANMQAKSFTDYEYVKAVMQVVTRRPPIFILENVPSVKSFVRFEATPAGFVLRHQITREYVELYEYYIEEHRISPTEVGVAQVRDRLFTIGSRYPNEFLFKPPLVDNRATMSTRSTFEELDKLREQGIPLFNDNIPKHSEEKIEKMSRIRPGEGLYGGINNKRLDPDKPAPVIMSSSTKYIHPWYDRLYTPREAAALMGIPNTFRFFGKENACFDQIGKGIVPQVAEFILKQVFEFLIQKKE